MSAFIVSKRHVAALVRFYVSSLYGKNADASSSLEMCRVLMRQNVRSVNERYNERGKSESFKQSDFDSAPILSPDQCLKACGCLEYQSCETDDWKTTRAYDLLQLIRAEAMRRGADKERAYATIKEWDL
jgi:hypothetical protein